MSTDPVRYDPDALDRFLCDRLAAEQPFVAASWAPARSSPCQTCGKPASKAVNVGALAGGPDRWARFCPAHDPLFRSPAHTCTVCHGICEGS